MSKFKRRSIRLKGYDYSLAGAYFVTLCTQDRQCLFGEVSEGEMQLNIAGKMITRWWNELDDKFSSVQTDVMVVMPNHIHGIVQLLDVGAPLCGRPISESQFSHVGRPHRAAPTLGSIVDWFKTMTTNEYIRGVKRNEYVRFSTKLWQRNYYEHVIRDDKDLYQIRQYIQENPLKWDLDPENPNGVKEFFYA